MHPSALENFQMEFFAVLDDVRWPMSARLRVLDMGGQDINGTVHQYLRNMLAERLETLDVLDIEPGAGVTIVGDARNTSWWDGQPYDVVISTEMLEHLHRWYLSVVVAWKVLRPGGWFIGTCASEGRQRHGATGAQFPAPGEHYENVDPSSLSRELTASRSFDDVHVGYEMLADTPTTHDLHWRARKARS